MQPINHGVSLNYRCWNSYMERQAEFIEAARGELGGLLEITAPDAGTHVVVAGHFTSVHLIYTKLKLAPKKKRTPIGFSTSGEESNGGTR